MLKKVRCELCLAARMREYNGHLNVVKASWCEHDWNYEKAARGQRGGDGCRELESKTETHPRPPPACSTKATRFHDILLYY